MPTFAIVNESVRFVDLTRARQDLISEADRVHASKHAVLGEPVPRVDRLRLVPGVQIVDIEELEKYGVDAPQAAGDPVTSLGMKLADLRFEVLEGLHPLIAQGLIKQTVHRPTLRRWLEIETRPVLAAALEERLAAKPRKTNSDYVAARESIGC